VPDVQVQVRPGSIEITEGGRRLTEAATPAGGGPGGGAVGEVRAYYDGGILEVFSAPATSAAVICRRDGVYDQVDVSVAGGSAASPAWARLTAWRSGPAGG
jgi:hypothetical protein